MSGLKTAALVAGGLVVGYFVVRKLAPPPPINVPNRNGATPASPVSVGGLIGAGLSAAVSIFGSKSSVVSTTRSNQLADATAASDTATGVIGFGGWDANSLSDFYSAQDSQTGVVGFGGWD